MLHFENMQVHKLWKALKEQRGQILIESTSSDWNNLFTEWTTKVNDRFNPFVYNQKICTNDNENNIEIVEIIKAIGNQLNINTSIEQFENVSRAHLETAAKMVLYMTPCSTPFKDWFVFYANLFKNEHAADILLALNRITKGEKTEERKGLKNVANKLLKRVINILSSLYKNRGDI